jgi:putative protease
MELLAPAGDWTALKAALQSGADGVYFGLPVLNARRRARNFDENELPEVVRLIREHGAKACLTLNIDVAESEVAQAARLLQLAENAGVDAILVRDPALLALRSKFPNLPIHFSTQTCMASSADVQAAAKLGIARVVLAREMSLDEIAAASSVPDVETEVFVQGALCCCVSGRCLMSSWVGGRSGNRGTCTSPCRVPWTVDGTPAGTPLSMRDLMTVHRMDDLRRAGVTALKIEGRMKTADWVSQAVSLYRRALQGGDQADLLKQADALGDYTGRMMTCGYLDEEYGELTGVAGRERRALQPEEESDAEENELAAVKGTRDDLRTYRLEVNVGAKGVECRCEYMGESFDWSFPKTVVRRQHKAVTIDQLLQWLATQTIQGCRLEQAATDSPDFLLVPRRVNDLVRSIGQLLQRRQKAQKRVGNADVPPAIRAVWEEYSRCPSNQTALGDTPDRVRLEANAVENFVASIRPSGVIVEGLAADRVPEMRSVCRRIPWLVALPPVFFESDIAAMRELLQACARAGATVEVNSWGGWWLAKEAGVRMEGGPSLPVLNSLAARVLGGLGLQSVTLSVEADRRLLQDLTAQCPVPSSLVVFGRPALMITRVALRDDLEGRVLMDRREVRAVPRREHGLWVLRPVDPFDLRDTKNDRIRVKHLVVDLVASPDPVKEWSEGGPRRGTGFRFNYDRTLQ